MSEVLCYDVTFYCTAPLYADISSINHLRQHRNLFIVNKEQTKCKQI